MTRTDLNNLVWAFLYCLRHGTYRCVLARPSVDWLVPGTDRYDLVIFSPVCQRPRYDNYELVRHSPVNQSPWTDGCDHVMSSPGCKGLELTGMTLAGLLQTVNGQQIDRYDLGRHSPNSHQLELTCMTRTGIFLTVKGLERTGMTLVGFSICQ